MRLFKYIKTIAVVFMLSFAFSSSAQETMQISVQVLVNSKDEGIESKSEEVYYGFFRDRATAEKASEELEKADGDMSKVPKKYKNYINSSVGGSFVIDYAFVGGCVFVMTSDLNKKEFIDIKKGITNYTQIIDVARSKEVTVRNKNKTKRNRTGGTIPIRKRNGKDIFTIHIERDSSYNRHPSRIIIQVNAVDCMTDDVVDLCTPIVYESEDYHVLQDKRKDYDFFHKDPLAKGYLSSVTLKVGEPLVIDTFIEFTRPKGFENHKFRGPYMMYREDYHHVIDSAGWEGTCLDRDPWKFLDYSKAYGSIPLDREEFYEEPGIQINNVTKKLDLLFEKGKSILRDTYENDSVRQEILQTLRAYDVVNTKIKAYSSPEGGYQRNLDLARGRAEAGARLLGLNCGKEHQVTTWKDVIEELEKDHHFEEASFIRDKLSSITSSDSLYNAGIGTALKGLPTYTEIVEPALARLRKMELSFGYIESRPMTDVEVVKHYYKNKHFILSGDSACRYTNGDFFNLYNNVRDSLEQDTITMMAYKKLSSLGDEYYKQQFAPYVMNRMAILKMQQGKPDTTILKPLIDQSIARIGVERQFSITKKYKTVINRKEIVQNQALAMFFSDNIAEADTLLSWLRSSGNADANVTKFLRYIDLINFEGEDNLTDEEYDRYEAAKSFVLNSDVNKAILYAELHDWKKYEEARDKWINLLDDDNPRKWYLKALAWSEESEAGKEKIRSEVLKMDGRDFEMLPPAVLDSLNEYDDKSYDSYMKEYAEHEDGLALDKKSTDVDVRLVPFYLAYFQHCFDIDKSPNKTYKRYYFNEGNVSDELRKKYPYLEENVEAYRKLFRMLKRYDNKARKQLQNREGTLNE